MTISSGDEKDKVYDSADKLFELCVDQPIGIMIYNGMTYMGMPLPPLIKSFREQKKSFSSVEDAAKEFLLYLNSEGQLANERTLNNAIRSVVEPVFEMIKETFDGGLLDRLLDSSRQTASEGTPEKGPQVVADEFLMEITRSYLDLFEGMEDAKFMGGTVPPRFLKKHREFLVSVVDQTFSAKDDGVRDTLVELARYILRRDYLSGNYTGLVFCGFGEKERFPTLISFEVNGVICGKLKYVHTNRCDIDRDGTRAEVIPFAQKEMVDRFVYGLDDEVKRDIQKFCRETIPDISKSIYDSIGETGEEAKSAARAAEDAFLKGLTERAFEPIRSQSRKEIDDMVEFMPKQEMAKMAEALVELTSIKRRVSRGVETVGGPIDVAVISKSEGFVWIKRKHYFPAEANARYFERVRSRMRDD